MNDRYLEKENEALRAEVGRLASGMQQSGAPLVPYAPDTDEIDLRDLWDAIWKGKWIIFFITTVFAFGGVLYALSIEDAYQSTALLVPASPSASSSMAGLKGQFGGLASLAGVQLGGASGEDKAIIAITLLKTWGFLEDFIKDNHLEVEVFATKGWDKNSNKLLIDESVYDEENRKWVMDIERNQARIPYPTGWELFQKINNSIGIDQDKKTGLISLTVEHCSPFIAKKWVDLLIVYINKSIQMQDRKEALRSIEYLKVQVNKTSIAEMQTIFYQLIEEQTKKLMLAEISSEYALKTLSPAKVAEQRSKPKRAFIAILSTVAGGMLAVVISLVRYFRRKSV